MVECRGTAVPAVGRACEATTLAARGGDWATIAAFLGYESEAAARAAVLEHLSREG
jgi:hypothetical protein